MAMNHKATPEQWASVKQAYEPIEMRPGVFLSTKDTTTAACLLDLHARVEALEGLHKAVVDLNESFNLDPLVARVEALEATQHAHADVWRLSDAEREQFYTEMARPARVEALEAAANPSAAPAGSLVDRVGSAAIREVAAWLRVGRLLHAAELLEQQADR